VEIRQFASVVLLSEDVEEKLTPPPGLLSDETPGPPLRPAAPGRPPRLRMVSGTRARAPRIEGMGDLAQRRRILHSLASHELQAAELFAWALLAFPAAPKAFRRGLLAVLRDEQRHTRMYMARVEANGAEFGDYPVHGYFWNKTPELTSPLRFLCAMSLTFENANLDHTVEYAAAARRAGDEKTAAVIDRVHRDEIQHVRFGWTWLQRFKAEGQSPWEAFATNLSFPLKPARARGKVFHRGGREAAGLDADFIQRLEESKEGVRAVASAAADSDPIAAASQSESADGADPIEGGAGSRRRR
jgi:uncharacterized ferritin-like protein (DUF455 family)